MLADSLLFDECASISKRICPLQHKLPKVSIVFCAHNEEDYLLPTLQALGKIQTITPLEILAVNNASRDKTAEILSQSWVRLIHEKIKGISYARQAGLEAAKGEIILQTDADTIVPSTWVDAHLAHYEDRDCVWVSGGISFEWVHALYYLYRSGVIGFHVIMSLLGKRKRFKCIWWANMSYRKDKAQKIGGFEPGSDLWEDVILFEKLAKEGNIEKDITRKIHVKTSGRRYDTAEKITERIMKAIRKTIPTMQYGYRVIRGGTFQDFR